MRKLLLLAPLLLWVPGSCKKDEIPTYKLAPDSAITEAGSTSNELDMAARSDKLAWQAPGDWKQEKPGQFITAAYTVPGGGRVTVSKLGGDGGGLTANLNRWRGQLGFKPLTDNEVAGQPLKIADSQEVMLLFNLTSENATADADGILAGILPLETETWYFKFSGSVGFLRKSEGVFADFLRSVRMVDHKDS